MYFIGNKLRVRKINDFPKDTDGQWQTRLKARHPYPKSSTSLAVASSYHE